MHVSFVSAMLSAQCSRRGANWKELYLTLPEPACSLPDTEFPKADMFPTPIQNQGGPVVKKLIGP